MKTRFFAAPRRGGRALAKIALTGSFLSVSRDGHTNLKPRCERSVLRAAL